jgi:hypothetical protein
MVYVAAMVIMAGVHAVVHMIAVALMGVVSFMAMRLVVMLAVVMPSVFLILIVVIVHGFAFDSFKGANPLRSSPFRYLSPRSFFIC